MASADVPLDLIDRVRIASPCPMKWDDLEGDGPVRHCRQCDLDVHDLSEMTRDEVEELLSNRTGRMCGTFFRRPDGTLLTKDCPVGLRAVRIRTAKTLGRVSAALGVLLTGSVVAGRSEFASYTPGLRGFQPFAVLSNWIKPASLRLNILPTSQRGCHDESVLGGMIVEPRETPAAQPPGCTDVVGDDSGS